MRKSVVLVPNPEPTGMKNRPWILGEAVMIVLWLTKSTFFQCWLLQLTFPLKVITAYNHFNPSFGNLDRIYCCICKAHIFTSVKQNIQFLSVHSLHKYPAQSALSIVPSPQGWLAPQHSHSAAGFWMYSLVGKRKQRTGSRLSALPHSLLYSCVVGFFLHKSKTFTPFELYSVK